MAGGGFAPGQIPGSGGGLRRRLRVGGLFGDVAQAEGGADRRSRRFCLATALLAALVHGMVETTVWPETMGQPLAIIALGVAPFGAAFFVWDIGMKRGDIRVLGARVLRDAVAVDGISDLRRLCATDRDDCGRRDPDRRRQTDRGKGYGVEAVALIHV